MRILYVSGLYLPHVGGLEVLVHGLTRELGRRGHASMVLCSTASPTELGTEQVDGITVVRVDMNRILTARDPGALLKARRTVADVVRTFSPDVVHAHDIGPMTWLYRRTRGEHPPPLIVTVHTVLSTFVKGSQSPLMTELNAADRVTAVSKSVADDIVGLDRSIAPRLSVIPNGVALAPEPVTPMPEVAHLVYVGRLVHGKRVDLVIEATARLAHSYPELRLTIAGVGPCEASLRQLAAALGIADRVEFAGLVERERVPDILRRAWAVVMPSEVEGLPLAALEAAWMGRPVVGTRSTGLVDAVIDGETGLLIEMGDLDALTDALGELLAHPDRANALGTAARARAEQEFSLETCADRYEALYELAITQNPVTERV